jgi:4'-phosphopantetheinyl transferase
LSTIHASSAYGWSSFPNDLKLPEKQNHVWLASLDDVGPFLDAMTDCLSQVERDRAARFKFLADQRRYLIAHAALRSVLGMYLSVHPAAIELDSSLLGKPRLAPDLAGSKIEFNLSHSSDIALIAVARGMEVGVDVERVREDFAFEPIAQRFFTPREVTVLGDLPPELRREAFYKCWTSKEALMKGKGLGISGPLDEVQIQFTDTGLHVIPVLGDWTLFRLSPIGGYAAALALEKMYSEPRCYRWAASLLDSKHDP